MSKADEIRRALQAALHPAELDVVDDSESHRGHSGHREEKPIITCGFGQKFSWARAGYRGTGWCILRWGLS
jgi:stress-induced morphogen